MHFGLEISMNLNLMERIMENHLVHVQLEIHAASINSNQISVENTYRMYFSWV